MSPIRPIGPIRPTHLTSDRRHTALPRTMDEPPRVFVLMQRGAFLSIRFTLRIGAVECRNDHAALSL